MSENKVINPIIQRTKEARLGSKFNTQSNIAEALGITRDTYATYETRTLLAHDLIARFCDMTETNIRWLLTGEGGMKFTPSKFLDSMARVDDESLQMQLEIIALRGIIDKKST